MIQILVIDDEDPIRLQKNIAQKEALALEVTGENPVAGFGSVIAKLCNLSEIKQVETKSHCFYSDWKLYM